MVGSDHATMQLPGASTRLFRARSTATGADQRSEVASGLVAALRALPEPIMGNLRASCNGDSWDVDAVVSSIDRGLVSAEGVCLRVLEALAGPVEGASGGAAKGMSLADAAAEVAEVAAGTLETAASRAQDEEMRPADPGSRPRQSVQGDDVGQMVKSYTVFQSEGAPQVTPEQLKRTRDDFQSLFAKAERARVRSEEALMGYFLDPADLGQLLVVEVDQAIIDARMGPARERAPPGRRGRKRGVPQEAHRASVDPTPSKWNAQTQSQLCLLITCLLGTAPLESYGSMTKLTRKLASKLQFTGACQGMQLIGATLGDVRGALDAGRFVDPDEFLSSVETACKESVDAYLLEDPGVRKGKVVGYADSFVKAVSQALVDLLGLAKPKKIKSNSRTAAELGFYAQAVPGKPAVKLPSSIAFNKEPFRQGAWRKTPFKPRPYVRLEEYDIVEEFARQDIALKLRSEKRGSCSGAHCTDRQDLGHYSLLKGGFVSHCDCLSRNMECSDACACDPSSCLNRAVSNRNAVRIGVDVEEIDSWGMDCYTRKNIHDAALESQAFGSHTVEDRATVASQAAARAERALCADFGSGDGDPTDIAGRARDLATGPALGRAGRPEEPQAPQEDHAASCAGEGPTLPVTATPPTLPASRTTTKIADITTDITGITCITEITDTTAITATRAIPTSLSAADAQAGGGQARTAARQAATEWIELVLVPAINKQGSEGWDLHRALDHVIDRASRADPRDVEAATSLAAARAVKAKLDLVGAAYFRLHPKGVGLVCKRENGLPPLTFIEEYLGEIHLPWRWFELQDAVKKITGSELPDFYNIVLERPMDDPAGYDVLFVDAAAKGAVASRMSHSCAPNCQAVVMSCNGRLTIAVYTLRHVRPGEELTFDYSSVTESEKEFKQAICLCGTQKCRGSYLYFTGSKAFMQILLKRHNFLHRQVLLARAASEPLNETDEARLCKFGLGSSCLGSRKDGTRVPAWLEKWTSMICEYLEIEETSLKEELVSMKRYDEATSLAEAKGVVMNRVQNIVITLDKIRMVLKQPNQTDEPPLRLITDAQVASYLWNGPTSVAKRLLRGSALLVAPSFVAVDSSPQQVVSILVNCKESGDDETLSEIPETLLRLALSAQSVATSAEEARDKLMDFSDNLRELDVVRGGGMTAAADLAVLYASTKNWISASRDYKTFASPKVPINLEDLFLNREADAELNPEDEGRLVTAAQLKAKKHEDHPALQKSYRPTYVWGQLSNWFKQTVNDPTASLSADRRGCLSLPDIDSAFKTGYNYLQKDRNPMLEQIETKPDSMWRPGTMWQFKNDAKCYGSPMLDKAWHEVTGEGADPMPGVLRRLREAKLPSVRGWDVQ